MKTSTEKPHKSSYGRINSELSDKLFVEIVKRIGAEKRYRLSDYTAGKLAEELGTNPRYISVVVASHTGGNYNALVNSYRLREACRMLRSVRYLQYNVEDIGLMVGFASRQSFYMAFQRERNMTPRRYRMENLPKGAYNKRRKKSPKKGEAEKEE